MDALFLGWAAATTRECEVLGAPSTAIDNEANRELFEDQVEILMKAFNSRSFSHYSKHYTIPPRIPYRGYELQDITLVPKPRTVPVECWQPIVSASERAMDFMASTVSRALSVVERGWWCHRQSGTGLSRRPGPTGVTALGTDLIIGFSIHIAETEQQAIKEARPLFEENMKMFGPLGFVRGLTDDQISALADPKRARSAGLPTLEQAVAAGSWLVGSPESIIEKFRRCRSAIRGWRRST